MRRRQFIKSLVGSTLLWKPWLSYAGQSPSTAPAPDPAVKRVLVMFKCHFDAGFAETQAVMVRRYFTDFFPQAIDLANQLRDSGSYRYVWTTGSWLLYEYLEQATPEQRRRMEQAIAKGDIAWHALPFTWQTEMLDQSMIQGSIGLSQSLDRRFGRTTTGAKMTDVPGHTRGLIAPLAEQGVKFIDIGVNDASKVPQVPPVFLWKAPKGSTLVVMYHPGYGAVVRVPHSDLAVATVVKDDDLGPHTLQEVHETYSSISRRFPNAEIVATNLTEIAKAIEPQRNLLPVVTSEIGDTWIHGVASDPLKVSRYREVERLRQDWLEQGKFAIGDATDLALLRHLLLEVEHTWGTDTKTWLDFDHYTPADLAPMLDTKNYKVVEFSWQEKRQELFNAIDTLPPKLKEEAQQAVQALQPKQPSISHPVPLPTGNEIETPYFILGLDSKTGAICRLRNKKSGREWASNERSLALFSYQTLSQEDYSQFFTSYVISGEDWAKKDFGKPNIERFGAKSQEWFPSVVKLEREETQKEHRLLARLEINDANALRSGRAAFPRQLYTELVLPKEEPVIHLNFYWFQKSATRMPEALWLSFQPITPDAQGWELEKSGEVVSPFDVVASGNRHMHSLSKGFSYKDGNGELAIETVDAPLVALGVKSPLYFSDQQPDLSKGVHCNLFNNAWGTNYLMWFGEDMRFRFVIRA
ncbi:MAG TPA: DUF5054 domain-containing protein [Candidatus Binatia bacterium]|nr:DUF5054 domain-containing protein [Candidatus Binatia bacterium]